MVNEISKIFSNPHDPNFWTAVSTIVTVIGIISGGLVFIINKVMNNSISKTSKLLVRASVEQYLIWIRVSSKDQVVNDLTVSLWISEESGGVTTGRSYLLYEKFIDELKFQGYKNLNKVDENTYSNWVNKYDALPKWGRIEW